MQHKKENPGAGDAARGANFVNKSAAYTSTGAGQPQTWGLALPALTVRRLRGDRWRVDIEGVGWLALTTSQLQSFPMLNRACLKKFGRVFAHIKRDDWLGVRLADALDRMRGEGGAK
jgi:hypothetical protein